MNKNSGILIFIFLIATFLRTHQLSNVPPSASLDEVTIGYNAYSILKTGADEYGSKFPVLLRAYDDWRPALYVYLVVPFINLFGLNVLSVRLPSVILSVFTVVATYFLVKEIFLNNKRGLLIAQVSTFLLAISPWHIYISRLGHEVNAGLSFIVFAILFFIKAVGNVKKRIFIFLSIVFFSLSLYTYQSEKVFVPLIILVLGFTYRGSLFKIKKELLISLVLAILLIIPIIASTLTPQGLIRFKGTSAFSENSLYRESAEKVLRYKNEKNIFEQIINNRRLVPIKIFAVNYFSHFNPKFIFFNSGNESFKAPNFGLLYIWEFPFLILGIVFLLKQNNIKVRLLLGLWLLISFIAPSLTTGAPHAMRAFNVLPVPQVLTVLGMVETINLIKENKLKSFLSLFYLCMAAVIIYSLAVFYSEYFYFFPKNQSSSFQYSLGKSIKFVLGIEKSYDKIIFSNSENLYQSYMSFLFYSKYDPKQYQDEGGTISGGFTEEHRFSRYEFRPIKWNQELPRYKILYIGNRGEIPDGVETIAAFKNLDERESIIAATR